LEEKDLDERHQQQLNAADLAEHGAERYEHGGRRKLRSDDATTHAVPSIKYVHEFMAF